MQVGPNPSLLQALSNIVQSPQQPDAQGRPAPKPAANPNQGRAQGAVSKASDKADLAGAAAAHGHGNSAAPVALSQGQPPTIFGGDEQPPSGRELPRGSLVNIVV